MPCSPSGDFGYITIPNEPWTEIAPRLFMGGSTLGQPTSEDFDSVLTMYRSAPWTSAPIQERRFHFADGRDIPDAQELADAVDWVYGQWAVHKKHVLIRCQAGLNRSGLLTALVLMKDGVEAADAIRTIRERRSPFALCNVTFESYLRSQTT